MGRWGAPGPVLTGTEILTSTAIRSSEHPARSESLYRLSYRGPHKRKRRLIQIHAVRTFLISSKYSVGQAVTAKQQVQEN